MTGRLTVFSLLAALIMVAAPTGSALASESEVKTKSVKFQRVPLQFIAALGDPTAKEGSGAESWGIWRTDPGFGGVWLNQYEQLEAAGGRAPAGWQFDREDWWLEEHGLIMPAPDFPLPVGRYLVTGDREVTTMLTVHPADENGHKRWELGSDATLFDVTHLPCRSARYTPSSGQGSCSPASANKPEFPVKPGDEMPAVVGCNKLDYAVLFVIAIDVNS